MSGVAHPVTNISNTGNNVNLCPTTQQVVNTGNIANEQGVVQNASPTPVNGFFPANNGVVFFPDNGFEFFPNDNFGLGGDIDFTGSSINVDGSVSGSCDQTIEQAAAA